LLAFLARCIFLNRQSIIIIEIGLIRNSIVFVPSYKALGRVHVACKGETGNAYRLLRGRPESERPLRRTRLI
jgi:hypothetical protein